MKTEKEKEKPVKKTPEKKEAPAPMKEETKEEKVVDEELQRAKRRIGPLADRVEKFDVEKMTIEQVRSLLDQIAALKVPEISDKAIWSKSDAVEKLQIRASNVLKKLQGPAVIKALAALDPSKLACIGVLIDRRNPDCADCPTQKECTVEFLKNTQDLFLKHKGARFAAAKVNEEAESKDAAQKVAADEQRTKHTKDLVKVAKSKAEKTKEPASEPVKTRPVYDPARKIKCLSTAPKMREDVPRPFKKMVLRIIKEQPETMGALREIMSKYYDVGVKEDPKSKAFISLYRDITTSENPKERIVKEL